jgi:inosose dehydratase
MESGCNRRVFSKSMGLGLGAAVLAAPGAQGASKRRLKIGHTGITWGYRPEDAEPAVKDVGSLGYHGFESFGNVLEAWEAKGGLGRLLDQAKLPLVSAYCGADLMDPAKRKDEVGRMVRWGKLIRKCGGTVSVVGPNGVKRDGYDFSAHKANIVSGLNEICAALAGIGVVGAVHQHTGTCIETRDEVYSVMEAVDSRYVKFGPDVGQLAKGGSDPAKIVQDFLELIEHVHLKEWDGGPHWVEYCPLGMGKVDIPAILGLLEKSKIKAMAMVELDFSPKAPPMTPIETARTAKTYLQKQGYTFRS